MKSSYWKNIEADLFVLMVMINLQPILTPGVFPTMDGASHLANANIINQLVLYKNQFFEQFLKINPEPVPNWTTHLFLSVLLLVLPAWIAEKILLMVLFISMPLVFRALIKTIAPEKVFYSFLIFPFTHSMFLLFGFFNFCISVVFFLLTIRFWIINCERIWHLKQFLLFTLLILITYFSHILTFGILLIVIATHIITHLIQGIHKPEHKNLTIRIFLTRSGAISLASLIPLLLLFQFFLQRYGTSGMTFLPVSTLLYDLVTLRPLIVFNPHVETEILVIFFIFIMMVMTVALCMRIKNRQKKPTDGWLVSVLIAMLLLYFFLPSALGTASYTNIRVSFLMFLIMIIALSTLPETKFMAVLVLSAGVIINMASYRNIKPKIRELEILSSQCYQASEYLQPGSVVMPVDLMDNWFTGHFADYIAVDKPVVMAFNYECETNYFPVVWNEEMRPGYFIGEPEDSCCGLKLNYNTRNVAAVAVDYVLILSRGNQLDRSGYFSPVFLQKLFFIIDNQFTLVYHNGHCKLYKSRKSRICSKMIGPLPDNFGILHPKAPKQI